MSSEAANTGLPGSVIATSVSERSRAPFWGARIDAQLLSNGNWQALDPRELTDMASNVSPFTQAR